MGTAAPLDLDKAIVDLVSRGAVKVPPYPAVAFQIEKLIRGGDYGLDELARMVSSDQVLSADVLRVSNSAMYSRGAAINSVKSAVGRIGAKDVARLALAFGLGAHATAGGKLAPLRRQVWLDSLASAALCQALARGRNLAPDEAFSAGLLHDFGKVVAIACIEELIHRRDDVAARPVEEWNALVDRYHVELGVVMAARWDLPPVMADVISLHHADATTAAADRRLVDLVVAVDEVTAMLGERTHLEPEDLGAAAFLQGSEGEVVSKALGLLPSFVASFETADAWKSAGAKSLVAAAQPPRKKDGAPAPPPWPVVLTVGGKASAYRILGVASTHFMVNGAAPVPENMLLEMKVQCDPPLAGYASVKLAWPDQGGFTMLVQPYALSGAALDRWKAIVADAAAEA
ncbi:MAG: HDOD domain-containing protein [Anaeromyxobacter sp.]|nr:HDOD domain-containing protein [Anaeromyxobacter sp.]MBL0278659.1 HDOD domain-containing protein [Anaeromyxobacter sp.]